MEQKETMKQNRTTEKKEQKARNARLAEKWQIAKRCDDR